MKAYNILLFINLLYRGVLTPAAAFRNTQYLNRLIQYDAATVNIESDQIIYKNHEKLN